MPFSAKYVPRSLSKSDRALQTRMLRQSKANYTRKKYETRKKLASFKSKPSAHVARARKLYGVETITPTRELAERTGCSLAALRKIVNKGEGAYYSSGSRPNQTAKSWGLARLASAVSGGKAAAVDFHILEAGCDHGKPAFKLARAVKLAK